MRTFCINCGPGVQTDIDWCCATCGCDAAGDGLDDIGDLISALRTYLDAGHKEARRKASTKAKKALARFGDWP